MNAKIEGWIDQLNNGEKVFLAIITEIYDLFPNIEHLSILPAVLINQGNLEIVGIDPTLTEDNLSIAIITFDLSLNGLINILNNRFILSGIKAQFKYITPESVGGDLYVSMKGNMTDEENTISRPVSIDLHYTDSLDRQWALRTGFEESGNALSDLDLVKQIINIPDLQESLPDYLPSPDNANVSGFELILSGNLSEIGNVSFNLEYGNWMLADSISLKIEEMCATYNCVMPYVVDNAVIFLEGKVMCGETVLPKVRVDLPDSSQDRFAIQMTEPRCRIADMSNVGSLFDDHKIIDSLPASLRDFNGVDLINFYLEIGNEHKLPEHVIVVLSTPADEDYRWRLLPGSISIKNISLECEFAPLSIVLRGIAVFSQSELAMKASLLFNENKQPRSVELELDTIYTNGSTVSLADFGFIGVNFASFIPGFGDLGLAIYDLHLLFALGEAVVLNNASFKIGSSNRWTVLPEIEIGNPAVTFMYKKGSEDGEADFYESIIHGEFRIGADSAPLSIELTVPNEGDWVLQIAGKSSEDGVSLPGLSDLGSFCDIDILSHLPNVIGLNGIRLADLVITFPHPVEGRFSSIYFEIFMPDVWNIASVFSLRDLIVSLTVDYTSGATSVSGKISGTFTLGAIVLPIEMPLPFNSQEWTIQLGSKAYLPSLSHFVNLIGFDSTSWLSELFGLIGIPEMSISVLNLKFDVSPFDLKKAEIKAEFAGGISLNLPPGIEIRMDSLEFYMGKSSGNLSVERYIINGAIIEKIGAETVIPVKIERTPDIWQITAAMPEGERIPIHVDLLESIIPGFKLPDGVGNLGVDIHAINLRLSPEMEVREFDVTFDIKGFGVLKILKNTIPVKVIYENLSGQPRYGVQLLDWPFNMGDLRYLAPPYDGWVLVDLGEFGAIKMELPKFFVEAEAFAVNGEVELTHDGEVIPLEDGGSFTGKGLNIPVKYLFEKMGMSFLDFMLPDRVPIAPEQNLGGIIRQAGGNPNNLPYDFLDYLDIEAPDGVQYDVLITSTGDVGLRLSLPDSVDGSKKPVKLLFPSGPDLLGLKFHNIGISTIFDVPVLNLDMEYDVFPLPLLVALSWFNTDSLDFLVDLRNVNFHFNARDTWILLVGYIPIPIFWDDLSFKYCGIEGVTLRSGIKFPRPGLSVADYPKIRAFIIQLARFISEREYLLQPQDLGRADLYLTLGPTWVGLPPYLDNAIIGTKDDVFSQSAAETVCLILNTMKDPALGRFLKIVPREIRFVDSEIRFGPIRAALKAGLTSVEEFKEGTVSHYPSDILERLFSDVEEGLLAIIYGNWALAGLVNFEVMLGISVKDLKGASLHAGIHGDIGGNFIACEITGVAVLDFENRSNPFVFDLRAKLVLLGQPLGVFITRIDGNGFYMMGSCTLIDWSGFLVKAELIGSLDGGGRFLLAGDAQVKMAGIDLAEGSARLSNSGLVINGTWLGLRLDLYSKVGSGGLNLGGSVALPEIAIDKTITGITVHTPTGEYTIGSLRIKCGISSGAVIAAGTSGIDAGVNVSFTFIKSCSFSFRLSTIPDSFDEMKDFILNEVVDFIIKSLLSVADAFEYLLNLIKEGWLVIEDIAGVLANAFGKSMDFIAGALKSFLDYSAEEIGAALKKMGAGAKEIAATLGRVLGCTGREISAILRSIEFNPVDVAGALKDALNYSAEQMVENFLKIGAGARDIAEALGKVFNKTAEEVAAFLKGMGLALVEIAGILRDALEFTAEQIAKALQFIGAGLAEISDALVKALGCAARELASALNYIGATTAEIVSALTGALGSAAEEIAGALKSIGKTALEIAGAMGGVLGTAADAMAGILKAVGFPAVDIAGSLKDVYHFTGEQAGAILHGIGSAAAEIAGALSDVFDFSADKITSMLKGFNVPVGDIANALYTVLMLPPVRVADLLKGIGASAGEIAGFLKGVNVPNVGAILDQVGFPDIDIGDALDIIGCPTDGFCLKCAKCDLCLKCGLCKKY